MELATGLAKLNLGMKTLRRQWEETRARWRDPVGQAYENNHIVPLEVQVRAALREIDRLGQVLSQARHECG